MKLIVCLTEAAGVAYGVRLLAYLKGCHDVETHAVVTDGARKRIVAEMNWTTDMVSRLAEQTDAAPNVTAVVPDTSELDGAIVAPCSTELLATILDAGEQHMLTRAVHDCLKRQRRVVLLVTETVLDTERLELMCRVSRMGAVVLCCPSLGSHVASVNDIVNTVAGTALDLVGCGRSGIELAPV